MKTMKYLAVIALSFSFSVAFAQKNLSDDDRIRIVPYISNQIENITPIVKNNLRSKLAQIVSRNGYSGYSGIRSRFIITPNISVLTKEVIAGAPTKVALTLDLALFVGDGIDGTKYASTNLELKGVGTNETKAYIAALKQISPRNKYIKELLEEGKISIVNYYNTNCDFIIGDIKKQEAVRNYEAALDMAMSVPTVSKKCYNRAAERLKPIFQKLIDTDCKELMKQGRLAWAKGEDYRAASQAATYLSGIDPASSCYPELKRFVYDIKNELRKDEQELKDKMKEDEDYRKGQVDKAWDFVLQKQRDLTDYRLKELEAYREVNIERARNQPKEIKEIKEVKEIREIRDTRRPVEIYKISGWW